MPAAFDWDGVMRACMGSPTAGGLGWTPREFWAATPREVAMALGAEAKRDVPPTRDALKALMARHPDGRPDGGCDGGSSACRPATGA